MTVIVDVDFGPTLFTGQFEDDVAVAADAQVLGGNCLYPVIRTGLISGPYGYEQRSFYESLPLKNVPTDRETSTGITASTAALRAIDLIDPIAQPDLESSDFGPPRPSASIQNSSLILIQATGSIRTSLISNTGRSRNRPCARFRFGCRPTRAGAVA